MTIPVVRLVGSHGGAVRSTAPAGRHLAYRMAFATYDSWFAPRTVHAIRVDAATGDIAHLESGVEALHALNVDLALVNGDALVDRIAVAVGGDREYALAVDESRSVGPLCTKHGRGSGAPRVQGLFGASK